MIETQVVRKSAKYGRLAYIDIQDDEVEFDVSGEEYGPIRFPLALLKEKIKEHDEKIQRSLLQSTG